MHSCRVKQQEKKERKVSIAVKKVVRISKFIVLVYTDVK